MSLHENYMDKGEHFKNEFNKAATIIKAAFRFLLKKIYFFTSKGQKV